LWFFLVPDPEAIGIKISEYNEEEALINVAAAEPSVLENLNQHQGNVEAEKQNLKESLFYKSQIT
jgi:hypothetical protein